MSSPIFATGTPVVSVTDNRGVMIRALNWNRNLATDPLYLLVDHHHISDDSRVLQNRDPRLFATWSTDNTAAANLRSITSLAGEVLRRESTDSGWQVALFDAASRPMWMTDGRGTVQTLTYDELGRPQSGSEQLSGGEVRVSWRNEYGDNGAQDDGSQDNNLRGVRVAHYNDGGLLAVSAVGLSGALLSGAQQFLASAETLPDWPDAEVDRQGLLETTIYTTTTMADARGALLSQTDAEGHQLGWRYDVNWRLSQQTLTLAGGNPQTLLESVTWDAMGQVMEEVAGNGVTTTYTYEPETQWLSTITAQRADTTVLQLLGYGYDNTGNVISVSDETVASRYYRNQATDGIREFSYDALYQLLSATGRENATSTVMTYASLPAMAQMDSSQYVNYTRTYHYDDSGNLQTLTHAGAGSFTRAMTMETTSNRSVQKNDGGAQTADEVAGWFDSNGNLLQLQSGSPPSGSGSATQNGLVWNGNNQLQSVTLVTRSSTDMRQNDREVYQYSGSSRVRKQTRTLVNSGTGLWNVDEVRYLTGLELRRSWQETVSGSTVTAGAVTEELHVLNRQAGRSDIRVLHWVTGKPDGIDNDQVRWSVDDNVGSLSLELDGGGQIISREEYYPFGGTAVWSARNEIEAKYKVVRYSGRERDGTGLYYYGHRYYAPWLCRWISADPSGEIDGLNLFRMVRNNPLRFIDNDGRMPTAVADTEFKESKPEPAIDYHRYGDYRLTRSVSAPNLQALESEQEHEHGEGAEFIGYHGTNEASARNIIEHGLDIDKIPHGQIGQGFYVAKDRALAEGSADPRGVGRAAAPPSLLARAAKSILSIFGSSSTQPSPELPDDRKPVMLKVYSNQPLQHAQWNGMAGSDLSMLKAIEDEQERSTVAQENIELTQKTLQMVIPAEEFHKLSVVRDNGVEETGKWPQSKESHAPEANAISSQYQAVSTMGASGPDASINPDMVNLNSLIRKRFEQNRNSYMTSSAM